MALSQHKVQSFGHFQIRLRNGGVPRCEIDRLGGSEARDVAFLADGAGKVAFGKDRDGLLVDIHQNESWELVDVHFVDGIPKGGI